MGFVKCNCGCGRAKSDASKIKKVVIPETEVKYVCEFSEAEFLDEISSDAFAAHKRIEIDPSEDCQRIETPKPLADDEVSVEDVKDSVTYRFDHYLYAFDDGDQFYTLQRAERDSQKYFFYCLATDDKPFSSTDLQELFKRVLNSGYDVYRIKGQETLFQWCLDQVRRAKGE